MSTYDFLSYTSCHRPCISNEVEIIKYTEVTYPMFPDGANSVLVVLVSTSITEIRESLLYDINSLVGELGGSLGLFLGLSLVQLYAYGLKYGKKLITRNELEEKE